MRFKVVRFECDAAICASKIPVSKSTGVDRLLTIPVHRWFGLNSEGTLIG
jgi:hypothetical protein